MPIHFAALPPNNPRTAVAMPLAAPTPTCFAVRVPPALRESSRFCPALIAPSPMAAATSGDRPGIFAIRPRAIPPPPIMLGRDWSVDPTIVDGFLIASTIVLANPSASPTRFCASRASGDSIELKISCVVLKSMPIFSSALPARPRVGMSAMPTNACGTPVTPFPAREISGSATARRNTDDFSPGCSIF